MTEIVSKELFFKELLFYPLIKSLYVLESNPSLFVVMHEYLEVKGYLDILPIQSASYLLMSNFLELLVVFYDIELSLGSLGLIYFCLLLL